MVLEFGSCERYPVNPVSMLEHLPIKRVKHQRIARFHGSVPLELYRCRHMNRVFRVYPIDPDHPSSQLGNDAIKVNHKDSVLRREAVGKVELLFGIDRVMDDSVGSLEQEGLR